MPALFILSIIRKSVHDKLIYSTKCYFLLWCTLNCHSNKRDVRVWRLYHLVSLMRHMLSAWNRRIEAILPRLILSVCGINREMNGRVMRRGGPIKFVALISVHRRDHVVVCSRRVGWIWIHGHHGSKTMPALNLVVNDLIKASLHAL